MHARPRPLLLALLPNPLPCSHRRDALPPASTAAAPLLTHVRGRCRRLSLVFSSSSLGKGRAGLWASARTPRVMYARFKDSAYVFVGDISFDLTEGDLLAIFAQYGEVVDVNVVRDRTTRKSKGLTFIGYEDQRSTILVVDNLNGAKVLERIIKVDHVSKYKKKEEEDEEEM